MNHELEDTKRGVVALYAELDEKGRPPASGGSHEVPFLSNMSHEFRTPLSSILAFSGLLLDRSDGELTAEQDNQVRFVRKAAESLLELVNDLLDLGENRSRQGRGATGRVRHEDDVQRAPWHAQAAIDEQSVNLVFEEAEDLPLLVHR